MIGSFWNLCRACPSMPVDKQLHSEYRSTYRWHEFTGNSRPEVVRRPPAPNQSQFLGPTNEPPLPRRKKCPELAYKSHEFIIGSEYTDPRHNVGANRMARSEERGTPSRRSKSEGPPAVPNGRALPIATEVDGTTRKQAGESNGLLKKTISKLSTEYRLQFVWPNVRRIKGQESNEVAAAGDYPKKSISMGALKQNQLRQQQHHQTMAAMPTVHKKRTTNQKEATLHELEPLVSDAEERKPNEKQVTIVEKIERKVSIRPFSQTFDHERNNHFITKRENFGFDDREMDNKQQAVVLMNGSAPPRSQPNLDVWFKEVVELRKKAGEYKCRGWGIEIDPELYKKQKDLWDQVSKRSSLSALSLASSVHRPITKEEKEQENNKKSTPISKAHKTPRVPGHALLIDNKDEMSALPARFNNIRHHLERTTGPDVEEGALLPSPTREKLMPAMTKRESESQRGSPKKTAASRHGSPQKGSPQKGSPKKVIKIRSQSVGPGALIENVSPKRQIRSASTAPTARLTAKKTPTTAAPATAHHYQQPTQSAVQHATATAAGAVPPPTERRPRPSTLSTTFHSRSKSSSLPYSARAHSVPVTTTTASTTTSTTTNTTTTTTNQLHPNQSHPKTSQSNDYNRKSPQPMRQMRKKDKDKSNILSSISGSNVNRVARSPRPKSTSAAAIGSSASASATTKPTTTTATATKQTPHAVSIGGGGVGGSGVSIGGVAARPPTSLPLPPINGEPNIMTMSLLMVPSQDNKLAENDAEDGRETAISISSCSPQTVPEVPEEPIVKSPPEPTRVKSPEQILMRSPDPVNWTVPLDTGKTFTVTQNVKEGENYSRPQSEIKASTPVEKPPPPPQSAPPQLTEQAKMDAWKHADLTTTAANDTKASLASNCISPTAAQSAIVGNVTTTQPTGGSGGLPRYETVTKPVPGSTLRCLDDPIFDVDISIGGGGGNTSSSSTSTTTNTASTARSTANDVLEKARDRFDRFWGGNKEDNV